MAGTDRNPTPPDSPPDGPGRSDAPGGGEIEWAGGLIPTPPAPGEVRVDPEADDAPTSDSAAAGATGADHTA
ncbi:hypothetical protein [Sphingomonas montanisoli]|uniref:Uncharacterized protein n=1 Tax=Sphingomonas montanisoli TaxID=2606412 RepID=A0A5D9C3A3_9SPHN|nr:hypothetical protein [Sphingomonas montanisoli]TZG25762.1 hypothetical protein FYJ91_12250 [Sphingomonas montanisoli]